MRADDEAGTVTLMQYQYDGQPAGMILVTRFKDRFLHQESFVAGNRCYDQHRIVRLMVWDIRRLIRSPNPG